MNNSDKRYIVRTHINKLGDPYYIQDYIQSPIGSMLQGTWDVTKAMTFGSEYDARKAATESGREAVVLLVHGGYLIPVEQ